MSEKADPPPRFTCRRTFHEWRKEEDPGLSPFHVTQAEFDVLRGWMRDPPRRCRRDGVYVSLRDLG